MAPHLDTNAANAIKAVDPTNRSQDKDGISTTSAVAETDTKPEPPQQPEVAGWFHWHEPGTSPEEKKLILKLDWFLLSFSCLMFFIKQVNTPIQFPSVAFSRFAYFSAPL